MQRRVGFGLVGVGLICIAWGLQAQALEPSTCMDRGKAMSSTNDQVLDWTLNAPRKSEIRALLQGRIIKDLGQSAPGKYGAHKFFLMELDDALDRYGNPIVVKVVFNLTFDPIPRVGPGQRVEACGYYIPGPRIIHFVHFNGVDPENPEFPEAVGFENGYVMIDGEMFGEMGPILPRAKAVPSSRRHH